MVSEDVVSILFKSVDIGIFWLSSIEGSAEHAVTCLTNEKGLLCSHACENTFFMIPEFTAITRNTLLVFSTQFLTYWASFVASIACINKIRACESVTGFLCTSEMHPV